MHSLSFAERVLSSASPFHDWPASAILSLARTSSISQHPRGAKVLVRGHLMDSVCVVGSGTVETRVTSSDGRQLILRHGGTGRVFGLLGFVDQKGAPHDVVAIEATTMVQVPMRAIQQVLQQSPSLWVTIAAELAARFRRQILMTEETTFEQISVRFARELIHLTSAHGEPTSEGISIKLRLSQERLGELVGVSRQTAAAHIRSMTTAGLLRWQYGHVTIQDIARLQAIAAQGVI